MTETQELPAPAPRPARGSDGGSGLLWRWVPLIVLALRRRFRETVAEMRKVLWPSRKEMTTYTVVVVIFVTVMVSIVAAFDYGLAKLVLGVFG